MSKQTRKRTPKYLANIQAELIAIAGNSYPELDTNEIAQVFGVRYQRVYGVLKVEKDNKPPNKK